MSLTVAITGPTGEIGLPLLAELEGVPEVGEVRGMARRPFDPGREGWEKVAYRRGDVLDRGSLAALFDGVDVAVHLAFAIFGSREQTRRVNLEGSRNVFEAAVAAGVKRLVYASSVAAYGFYPDNPQPLTEDVPARGSADFYYSAQKAELELALEEILAGTEVQAYVFRPCIVAGPRATMLIRQTVESVRLGDPVPRLRRGLGRLPFVSPVLPDPDIPIQLVHHDDVARALAAAIAGAGPPGAYNLATSGKIGIGDVARSIGWRSVKVPGPAADLGAGVAKRLRFASPQLEWATALRTPVLMDAGKARRELGWQPRFDAAETLLQTAIGAREEGLLD
ncbi:MAG TPA: NAD-dependent epimerase/dehydratase family protein [Solirubrobacterales bacterium]|nr:NAD-dependent epimerase/dehydratase family protein [Solirubrobacterales bacterium]